MLKLLTAEDSGLMRKCLGKTSRTAGDFEVCLARNAAEALALGAVDFISKPDGTVSLHMDKIRVARVAKVRGAATARLRQSRGLLDRVRHGNRIAALHQPAEQQAAVTPSPARHQPSRRATPGAAPAVPGLALIGASTGGPGVFARRIDSMCDIKGVEATRFTSSPGMHGGATIVLPVQRNADQMQRRAH